MKPVTQEEAIQIAKWLKEQLQRSQEKLPVKSVILFGSAARNTVHEQSDIDIAVICEPFALSRSKEIRAIRTAAIDLDSRVELIVLHPEDMENRYLTIAQDIKQDGVVV